MNHVELRGSHFEAGLQYGLLLGARGKLILEDLPFPITEARRAFAAACLPINQQFFPELLEELRGLVQAQHCTPEDLQAVLFTMYAMPPGCCCSCFAAVSETAILLGRNSDFLTELEPFNLNVTYHLGSSAGSFTGNTTAFLELEDGVNRHGLALGLTSVLPQTIRPGFQAGLLVRLLLETCRTTAEALARLSTLPIASAQTLTIADIHGDLAVVECSAEKAEVLRPSASKPYVCATNLFHAPSMVNPPCSEEECWFAETRYRTLATALESKASSLDLSGAQALLMGREGFLCQYDRQTGRDTVWSVLYDLRGRSIYRAEGNPRRHPFLEDRRFSF